MAEALKWLLGGGLVAVAGMLIALLRIAYKLGADAKEISTGLVRITKIEECMNLVPVLVVRIGNVENAYAGLRSDIKDLMREKRGSRPSFDGEE